MKKKLIILSAAIGLVLACFPFTLCAEEDPQSDLGISAPAPYYQLDSYFYNNYDLLPYIESDGNQYINTSISPSSSLRTEIRFSDLTNDGCLFGSRVDASNNAYYLYGYVVNNNGSRFNYYNTNSFYSEEIQNYVIYDFVFDRNLWYANNQLVHEFSEVTLNNNYPIYIFTFNTAGTTSSSYGHYKLYSFSIYDYSANDGEGAYLRCYYPAKAKSGGTIGLYDAVSKTFVTTSGNTPFANPTDDKVLNFQISDFITAGLGWIGDILDFAIAEPVIILFMAIGLAGAMFRWGRRLVHF